MPLITRFLTSGRGEILSKTSLEIVPLKIPRPAISVPSFKKERYKPSKFCCLETSIFQPVGYFTSKPYLLLRYVCHLLISIGDEIGISYFESCTGSGRSFSFCLKLFARA